MTTTTGHSGRVAVITAASSGIGEATARALAAEDIAQIIAFTLSRPRRVAVNEILIRPAGQA